VDMAGSITSEKSGYRKLTELCGITQAQNQWIAIPLHRG